MGHSVGWSPNLSPEGLKERTTNVGLPKQFRFLHTFYLTNLKDSVGLILSKSSDMRVSIPTDWSTRPFMHVPRFIPSRRPPPLLTPTVVLFPQCTVSEAHDVPTFVWHSPCKLIHYEQQLEGIHTCGCRCYERLKAKTDGSTRLAYTGLRGAWNT